MTITTTLGEYHVMGGVCHTSSATSGGGTSEWIYVQKDNVGVDLSVTSGTARVEMTSCAPSNIGSAVVTTVNADSLAGQMTGPTFGSTVVNGATAVRLVASGVAQLSVRS
jgi:hypothetical protein